MRFGKCVSMTCCIWQHSLGRRMGDLRHPVSSLQPRCRIPLRFPSPQTIFSPYIPLSALGGGKNRPNPTDRGKSGVKRSLLTEAQGIPVGLAVDGANRHDMKLVRATVDSLPVPRPAPTPERPPDRGMYFFTMLMTLISGGGSLSDFQT